MWHVIFSVASKQNRRAKSIENRREMMWAGAEKSAEFLCPKIMKIRQKMSILWQKKKFQRASC